MKMLLISFWKGFSLSKRAPRFLELYASCIPLSYLIGGMATVGIANKRIEGCSIELLSLIPPAKYSCREYLSTYLKTTRGYLPNPEAFDSCVLCLMDNTNDVLLWLGISYDERRRNFTLMVIYVAFMVIATSAFYGLW
jgi:ATP-binding cassette subfamily G (WHITE) protein 2 (PDR)